MTYNGLAPILLIIFVAISAGSIAAVYNSNNSIINKSLGINGILPGQMVKSNSAINGFEYNLSKIISEIKESEAYSSIINGSGIVPDWNSLVINESRRLSSDLLELKLYIPNTSRRGLALLIT